MKKDKVSPTFLMSFWRCGSNFLANVVKESGGLNYETIYHPELPLLDTDIESYTLIKSHAPSYAHLLAELGAFCPDFPGLPHRFIVLWRDPRDMIISFYDWLCTRLREDIPQGLFLHEPRYGYAVAGMGQMNLIDTYQTFVENWRVSRTLHNMFTIRFEDILTDKHSSFTEIFKYLGLDAQINEDSLEKRVKLGASSRDERGVAGAWRRTGQTYSELLDHVHRFLGAEINVLGYDERVTSDYSMEMGNQCP